MSKINNTNYINIGDSQNESLIQKREERQIREEYKGKVENALKSSIIPTSKLDSPYKNKKISDLIKETFNSDYDFDKKISELSNYLEIKKKLLDSEFIDSSNSEEIENLEEILKFLEMRKISSLSNKNTFKGMRYLNSSERKILDNEKINISEQISELKNEDKKLEEQEEALLAKLAELYKKREYIKGNIKSKESGDEVLSNRISLLDEGLNENKKEFVIPKRGEQTSFENDSKKDSEENIKEGEKQNDIQEENQGKILNSDASNIEQNLSKNYNEESLENESNGEVVEVNQNLIDQIMSGNSGYSIKQTKKVDIELESEKFENIPGREKIFTGKQKRTTESLLPFVGKNLKNGNEKIFTNLEDKKNDKLLEKFIDFLQVFEGFDKDNLTSEQIEEISKCKQAIEAFESKDFLEEEYKNIISKLKTKIATFGLEQSEENNPETEENKDAEKTELSEVEKQALEEIQKVDEFYNNEENLEKFGNRIFDFISSIFGKNNLTKKEFDEDLSLLSKINFSYRNTKENENLNTIESIKNILEKNIENFKKFLGIEEEMEKFSKNYEQNNLRESFEVIRDFEKKFFDLKNRTLEFEFWSLDEKKLIEFEKEFNGIVVEYNKAIENIKNYLENDSYLKHQEVILICEDKISYIDKIILERLSKFENNNSLIENESDEISKKMDEIPERIEKKSTENKSKQEMPPKPSPTRISTPVSVPEPENTTFSANKETSEYIEKFPKNIILPKKEEKITLELNEYVPGIKDGKGWKIISDQYVFSEFKDEKPNGLTVIYTETGIKKSEGIYKNLNMETGLHFDEKGKIIKKTVNGKTTKA